MNICFVANFSKTYLHEAIASELSKDNIQIYWIAVNRDLYNHLLKTYDRNNILLINKENIHLKENPLLDFKINELVYGDRILREYPSDARRFLTNIQRPIFEFIQENKIGKIFGELTWAHEILIHRICSKMEELDCTYLNPHVVRIPNNRFAFFTDERQSKLLEFQGKENDSFQILKPKPPNYLKINRSIQRKKNSWLGKLINLNKFVLSARADSKDPSMDTRFLPRLKNYFQTKIKGKFYQQIEKSSSRELLELPFVFIGLHKQPEASVDVFGRYYEDQLTNVKTFGVPCLKIGIY